MKPSNHSFWSIQNRFCHLIVLLSLLFSVTRCADQEDPLSEVSYSQYERSQDQRRIHSAVAIERVFEGVENQIRCTGTIISPRLVLTASHCIHKPPVNDFADRAGDFRILHEFGYRRGVDAYQVTKYYDAGYKDEFGYALAPDLALMEIEGRFPYDAIAQIADFEVIYQYLSAKTGAPVGHLGPKPVWPLTGAGYGATKDYYNRFDAYLFGVENDGVGVYGFFGPRRDPRAYQIKQSLGLPMEVIAGSIGQGGCKGDSGGGLFMQVGQEYVLVGVASRSVTASSFHTTCSNSNHMIYTLASFGQKWFKSILSRSDYHGITFRRGS